ncbi:transposase, partial [Alkalicoccus chagannorensis]
MAKNQSKHHSREFRDYVAKHVIQDGRKISEVADYLNVPYGTLKRWVGEIRAEQKKKEAERQSKLLSATECAEALAQE